MTNSFPMGRGGITGNVEIKGVISKFEDNKYAGLPDLSTSDAKNGVGWYNVTLGYSYYTNQVYTGNLYFDGTYFNGVLSGIDFYYGDNYYSGGLSML